MALCYAVALTARRLNTGQFDGLNCESFLNEVERLLELIIRDQESEIPTLREHGEKLFRLLREMLQLHEEDLDSEKDLRPTLRLVWSRQTPQE